MENRIKHSKSPHLLVIEAVAKGFKRSTHLGLADTLLLQFAAKHSKAFDLPFSGPAALIYQVDVELRKRVYREDEIQIMSRD